MTYKMVVFDWDGTVFDSTGLITDIIRLCCADTGLPDPGQEAASFVIGMGLQDALANVAPNASEQQINEILQRYRHHYVAKRNSVKLFPQVVPLLTSLTELDIICSVATGMSRVSLNHALERSNTGHFFSASRTADECLSKPHPQMLEELLSEFGLTPKEALMIGDTTHDLNMAKSIGMPAISVQSGAHSSELLQSVPHIKSFPSINEAAPWLVSSIKSGA